MPIDRSDAAALHPAFVEVLRNERSALNQRFALRQRGGAKINEADFLKHLSTTVDRMIRAVAAVQPERVRATVEAMFDASLDLFAAGLLGTETRHPYVAQAWHEVLPHAARLLARDPLRVVGSLSNAVDYLAQQVSTRPSEWIGLMRDISPRCDSVNQWLDLGKVAAWRSGLVQFRPAALQVARELPRKLTDQVLGIPSDLPDTEWHEWLKRLGSDRWWTPSAEGSRPAVTRLVGTTGGFRGFGGVCRRPPKVVTANEDLYVSDGDATWLLLADAFGTWFHRVATCPPDSSPTSPKPRVSIAGDGTVIWEGESSRIAQLAEPSSYAFAKGTLAVTLATSHHVFLVAHTPG